MYNEIIPEQLQAELLRIRDSLTQDLWKIGDITLAIQVSRPEVSPAVVNSAVGMFVGKAQRTIREYVAMSKFYPQEIREQFDVLTHEHFRVAMRFGDRWLDALAYAEKQVEELNRPATVDDMESVFSGKESRKNFDEMERLDEGEEMGALMQVLNRLREMVRSKYTFLPARIIEMIDKIIGEIEAEVRVEVVAKD